MPRQIIVLETNPAAGGMITINAVFWFPQTPAIPNPSFVSRFKTPTPTEATALQDGTVIEEFKSMEFAKSLSATSLKALLVAAWTDRKAYRDSQPNVNQNYGLSYDGAAWSA
jgi:hypothetical protein